MEKPNNIYKTNKIVLILVLVILYYIGWIEEKHIAILALVWNIIKAE